MPDVVSFTARKLASAATVADERAALLKRLQKLADERKSIDPEVAEQAYQELLKRLRDVGAPVAALTLGGVAAADAAPGTQPPKKDIQLELRSVLEPPADTLGGFGGYPAGAPLAAPDVQSQDVASQVTRPVPELRVPSLGRTSVDTSELEARIRSAAAITGKWVKAGAREYVRAQLPSAIVAGGLAQRAFARPADVEAGAQKLHEAIDAPQPQSQLEGPASWLVKGPQAVRRFLAHLGVDLAADSTTPGGAATMLDPSHLLGPGARVAGAAAPLVLSPAALKRLALKLGLGADTGVDDVFSALRQQVGVGHFPSTSIRRILYELRARDGYTVNLVTGDVPSSGLMVGKFANTDPRNTVILRLRDVKGPSVATHVAGVKKELAETDQYLGLWHDKNGMAGPPGRVYIDTSVRFEPGQIRAATKFGEGTGQGAGYRKTSKTTGEDFPTGNHPRFVGSDEFQARMDAMYAVGLPIMSRYQYEWWDLTGGPLVQTYGQEFVRPLAGFLASTSPQSDPVHNLRQASEYMRRLITFVDARAKQWGVSRAAAMTRIKTATVGPQALDPQLRSDLFAAIIQPTFRIPPGARGYQPGGMMFGESKRVDNLTKAATGDLDAIRADKVNDMAHALIGADVGVFDRHWAKLSESWDRGIFAEVAPDTLQGSMGAAEIGTKTGGFYDLRGSYVDIENAARTAVQRRMTELSQRSRTPLAHYTATVWEGIRETILRTGELFGDKYRASAIPTGPGGGFNNMFWRVVDEKARALGLTREQMVDGLRQGKLELLSAVLATNVGWLAYQMSLAREAAGASPRPQTTATAPVPQASALSSVLTAGR